MLLQSVSDFTNVQFITSFESFSNNQQAKNNKTNTLINNVEQNNIKKKTKLLCHNSISVRIFQCCVSMRQVCVNHD